MKSLVIVLVAVVMPVTASAQAPLLKSLAIPGTGQAEQGNYTKAAAFAGLAIVSAVGAIVSAVQYNQAVDRFRQEKRFYLAYQEQLSAGEIVSIDDVNATFTRMQDAFDDADARETWRDTFIVSLIATYALNVVDVLISKPYEPKVSEDYEVETRGGRVMVTRTFRF